MPRSSAPATAAELRAAYQLVGVPTTASPAEIRKRYHRLARQWHPDRFAGRTKLPLAETKMRAINAAYRLIENAPLAGESPVEPPRWATYGRATGTFMSWLRTVEGTEPRVPDGPWERDCPNCRKRIQVEGCRYAHCRFCGVGFFPDQEGMSYRGEWAKSVPRPYRMFALAVYILVILEALAR